MLCYCERCGYVNGAIYGDEINGPCFCCGYSPYKVVPNVYVDNFRWRDGDGKEALMEEVVKKSPVFDPYFFIHRDEIRESKNREMQAREEATKQFLNSRPRCPTCQSTNVQKIGFIDRATSIAFWGIFSKKINKSFKCNDCGYTW